MIEFRQCAGGKPLHIVDVNCLDYVSAAISQSQGRQCAVNVISRIQMDHRRVLRPMLDRGAIEEEILTSGTIPRQSAAAVRGFMASSWWQKESRTAGPQWLAAGANKKRTPKGTRTPVSRMRT